MLQFQALQRISTKAEQRASLVSCSEKCKYLKYTYCVCYRIITMNPIRSIDTRCMNYMRQVASRRSYEFEFLVFKLVKEIILTQPRSNPIKLQLLRGATHLIYLQSWQKLCVTVYFLRTASHLPDADLRFNKSPPHPSSMLFSVICC